MIPVPALRMLAYAAREAWRLEHADGSAYLDRHVLWGVNALEDHDPAVPSSGFVHQIYTPDGDRHMHNHPWAWSAAVVLAGGYTEERLLARGQGYYSHRQTHRVGDLNTFRTDDYHRITHVEPGTVTLFLCGREVQDWGFLVDGVHVGHAEYFATRPDAQHMRTVRL